MAEYSYPVERTGSPDGERQQMNRLFAEIIAQLEEAPVSSRASYYQTDDVIPPRFFSSAVTAQEQSQDFSLGGTGSITYTGEETKNFMYNISAVADSTGTDAIKSILVRYTPTGGSISTLRGVSRDVFDMYTSSFTGLIELNTGDVITVIGMSSGGDSVEAMEGSSFSIHEIK